MITLIFNISQTKINFENIHILDMGNEQSQLPGIEIEEKAIEVSDFWSQHSANIFRYENHNGLSVFIGELCVNGSLWSSQTPLEKSSKNLMIYRHPCIIKFISSWKKNSKYYLAVEEIIPLSQVLPTLNTLQICIGLHSILKALTFLHENASSSHNNICISSIYVTKDGSWKLGGMEYLCRYKDISCDYLNKTKSNRYNKAIDPNEDRHVQNTLERKDFIDVYGYGVLVCEILKSRNNDEISSLSDFLEYCKNDLQSSNVSQRPKLSSILQHEFFNHEYITIYSFLVELPLKSDEEKNQFFLSLGEKLKNFNEVVIANQFCGLILSRMVLLNKTAQDNFLPLLLTPRIDEIHSDGLFCQDTFKKYLSPKLLEIFRVRDAQIRLLLLQYFPKFMHTFTKEELQSCILPELLLGIKDTNDHLVSVTLRTLADLVSILGAATVIGGKRARLFNDGRPTTEAVRRTSRNTKPRESIQPNTSIPDVNDQISLNSLGLESNNINELPERPRPDGEEGETSTEEIEQSVDEDLDNWEDWDINENNHSSTDINLHNTESVHVTGVIDNLELHENSLENQENSVEEKAYNLKRRIPDISELDIKNQLNDNIGNDEFDFFQDMEPIIESSNKFLINGNESEITPDLDSEVSKKLTLNSDNDGANEEGWGNGDWE